MRRSPLFRRALAPALVAGAAAVAVLAGASPASALSRPGINVSHYQLTATESWNVCGGSDAVIHFVDSSAVMTVNCATGGVTIYTPAN